MQSKYSVTVVIATYGRPDALACAIKSVLLQTFSNWRMLIVGDACGEETKAILGQFLTDPRTQYVNLPWRCGEQALLNSAAMAVAQSDFIAFLNQDDLWLPSHLEIACRRLREPGANFFMGRSAWSWGQSSESEGLPLLESISPEHNSFSSFFTGGLHYVEPVSAWVITSSLARNVGPWKRSLDIFRQPIQDWVLRAWRTGGRLVSAEAVTSVKFENQWAKNSPDLKYNTAASPQEALLGVISDAKRLADLTQSLEQLSQRPEAIGRGMELDAMPTSLPILRQLTQRYPDSRCGKIF